MKTEIIKFQEKNIPKDLSVDIYSSSYDSSVDKVIEHNNNNNNQNDEKIKEIEKNNFFYNFKCDRDNKDQPVKESRKSIEMVENIFKDDEKLKQIPPQKLTILGSPKSNKRKYSNNLETMNEKKMIETKTFEHTKHKLIRSNTGTKNKRSCCYKFRKYFTINKDKTYAIEKKIWAGEYGIFDSEYQDNRKYNN